MRSWRTSAKRSRFVLTRYDVLVPASHTHTLSLPLFLSLSLSSHPSIRMQTCTHRCTQEYRGCPFSSRMLTAARLQLTQDMRRANELTTTVFMVIWSVMQSELSDDCVVHLFEVLQSFVYVFPPRDILALSFSVFSRFSMSVPLYLPAYRLIYISTSNVCPPSDVYSVSSSHYLSVNPSLPPSVGIGSQWSSFRGALRSAPICARALSASARPQCSARARSRVRFCACRDSIFCLYCARECVCE